MNHFLHCEKAFFVTLTYDTQYLPFSPSGLPSLCKQDLQLYFKRLRQLHYERYGKESIHTSIIKSGPRAGQTRRYKVWHLPPDKEKIQYYACGEYGTKTHRPHYHIILFNADKDLIEIAWTQEGIAIGNIHIGSCNIKTTAYTLKYLSKPKKVPLFDDDDRQKEASLISKGLGLKYITPKTIKWHHADLLNRVYLTMLGGIKIPMPEYYKKRIYSDWQLMRINQHFQNLENEKDAPTLDEVKSADSQKRALIKKHNRGKSTDKL